jgi:amidase
MPSEVTGFSATELVARIANRELGAEEVFKAHVEVIEANNSITNALVTLCLEHGLDEARQADRKIGKGDNPGVLNGLPYAVKDTLPTRGVRTTCGSLLFENHVPDEDALHVERARHAGAIVIGKTNTPEFASGTQTDNAVFGLTRNPHDPSKTVTGSSGGSAAALAANMVPMADGSDLGGSLRSPASVCGVVGFRPSAGQIPKRNARLPFDRLHVFGPMARCVEDIALFMSVFAGYDENCPLSVATRDIDFTRPLDTSLRNTRIAFSTTPCDTRTDPQVRKVLESQLSSFTDLGCRLDPDCPDIGDNHAAHLVTVALNAVSELGQFIDDERFGRSQRLRKFLQQGQLLTVDEITKTRRTQARCWHILNEFFKRYDFLLWPTMAGLPYNAELKEDEVEEDWRPVELTPSLNLPAISLPAGLSEEGLPIGIQLLGPPNSDFKLLQLAYGFQQSRI